MFLYIHVHGRREECVVAYGVIIVASEPGMKSRIRIPSDPLIMARRIRTRWFFARRIRIRIQPVITDL